MVRVAFCSENVRASGRLEQLLLDYCKYQGIAVEISVFSGENDLECQRLDNERIDIFYIDTFELNNREEIVKRIRESCQCSLIIFALDCVSDENGELSEESFMTLRKPIHEKEFLESFREAYHCLKRNKRCFVFRYRGREDRIPMEEILYFESRGRKILLHLRDGGCKSFNGRLSQVERKLLCSGQVFLRIHQSYLVNYSCISSRMGKKLELTDGTILPISESRAQPFQKRFEKLLEMEIRV